MTTGADVVELPATSVATAVKVWLPILMFFFVVHVTLVGRGGCGPQLGRSVQVDDTCHAGRKTTATAGVHGVGGQSDPGAACVGPARGRAGDRDARCRRIELNQL
jgi:hypothetical protein